MPHLTWQWLHATSVVVLVCCISLVHPVLGDHGHIQVKAGESIQAAVDGAQPGAWIFVEAGTYAEQLTVQTDGIHLIGKGAILVPPSTPTENTCSGLAGPDTEAGICVTGQGIQLADFVVEHRKVLAVGTPVKDVLVTGFDVRKVAEQFGGGGHAAASGVRYPGPLAPAIEALTAAIRKVL